MSCPASLGSGRISRQSDDGGIYHEEKVPTVTGDYARYYDALYETIMNGKEQLVKPEETIAQIEIMENAIKGLK